ncbi:MAG: leucine-rich repeat domain-containing protein [Muribaculaceae bacterium]|nr:leucine-rich repeat domain-containing protein [Muribaculaceae bacterium]
MYKFIDLDTGLPAALNKIKTWVNTKLATKQDAINDLATIRIGAAAGTTAVQDNSYVHTDNNYTTSEKTKLAGLPTGTDVYTKEQIDDIVAGIEAGEIQVISVDNVVIVDSHTNNTVNAAPSARQMKMMYDNVMAIYNALAGIAFTNGKPTLDWIGNVTTYSMDVTGLTNIVAPTITSFTEGYLATIELSPAAGYSLEGVTINVTDMNNQPVSLAQAPTYNSTTGKVVFKIAVNQNFKVSGTAVAAKTISVADAHLHLVPSSVLNGGNYSGTMTADEGYLVPVALSSVSGVSAASITYTRASNGKSATVAINNVTANITISDAAVQLNLMSITLPGDENIKVEDANGNTMSGTQLVYEGDPFTCVVRCNNGFEFANVPAISGQTPTVQTDGSYRFDVASVTTNISVTATAEAITSFTSGGLNYVLLSGNLSAKVTVKSGTTDAMANANTGDKYTGSIEVPASATYCGASYNVTQIDNFAFYNCTGITAMSLPEGLTYIGSHSFRKTTGMTTCNFPSTLTTIKSQAFRESGLLSIDFSACDALTISAYAFHSCSATSLTFKKGSTITAADKDGVGSYLFNTTKITNLVLNCTFKSTGYYDFMNCAQLKTITFTEDYQTVNTDWQLGNAMFINCAAITDIYVRKTDPLRTTASTNDNYCPFKTTVRSSATVHIPTTATLSEWQNGDGNHNFCWQFFTNISQDINLNA